MKIKYRGKKVLLQFCHSLLSPFLTSLIVLFLASPECSTTNQMEVFFVPTTGQTPQPGMSMGQTPIVISANVDSVTSSTLSENADENDDGDFCIIDDTGWGKAVSINPPKDIMLYVNTEGPDVQSDQGFPCSSLYSAILAHLSIVLKVS